MFEDGKFAVALVLVPVLEIALIAVVAYAAANIVCIIVDHEIQQHAVQQAKSKGKSGKGDKVEVGKLKRLPDDKIGKLGGELYTSGAKAKTGKSRSDLYWNPQTGDVYSIPKNGGPPEWVDKIPTK